jgi:signal transduction histidine kinase
MPSSQVFLFEIVDTTLSGFTILIGAIARQAECFWYKQANMKEQRLKRIRSDIAKDMHDLVSYSMSQTVLRARASSEDPAYSPETKAEFAAIARTGADTLHELRILLHALQKDSHYRSLSNDSPSIHAIENIIVSANLVTHDVTDAGFHMSYHIADHINLTRAQTLVLSRILREIGANIIRHGDPATPATLTISQNQDCIRILSTNAISDNLNGALPSSGMGILSMRERLETLGGTLTTSIEDGAWIISAVVPQTTTKERAE